MKYNPKIHHRRSVRLKGYDYAKEGLYFITICTQNRIHFFGEVEDSKMVLSPFGEIAHQEWEKLPDRWPHIELGAFQIMPNHMHGVLLIQRPFSEDEGMELLEGPDRMAEDRGCADWADMDRMAADRGCAGPVNMDRGCADRGCADRGCADRVDMDRMAADWGCADRAVMDHMATDRGCAGPVDMDRTAADRGCADRVDMDRMAADWGCAGPVDMDRTAADRGCADRADLDRKATDRGCADRAVIDRMATDRAATRAAPTIDSTNHRNGTVGATLVVAPNMVAPNMVTPDNMATPSNPSSPPPETPFSKLQWATRPYLGQIMGAYKSIVSTTCLEYHKTNQPGVWLDKIWQRGFDDRIIRNALAFKNISNYILHNPANWKADKFFD